LENGVQGFQPGCCQDLVCRGLEDVLADDGRREMIEVLLHGERGVLVVFHRGGDPEPGLLDTEVQPAGTGEKRNCDRPVRHAVQHDMNRPRACADAPNRDEGRGQ
jgi:hypothetical protein